MFVSIQKKGSRFEFIAGESLSDDPSFRFRSSEDFYLVEGLRSTYASYAEAHDAAMWLTTFRPSHIQAKKASRCIAEIGDQILSPEDSAVSHYNEQITIIHKRLRSLHTLDDRERQDAEQRLVGELESLKQEVTTISDMVETDENKKEVGSMLRSLKKMRQKVKKPTVTPLTMQTAGKAFMTAASAKATEAVRISQPGAYLRVVAECNEGYEAIISEYEDDKEDDLVVISFSPDFVMESVMPAEKVASSTPYHSRRFLERYWEPVVNAVGHIHVQGCDTVIVPGALPGKRRTFAGFSKQVGTPRSAKIELARGGSWWVRPTAMTKTASTDIANGDEVRCIARHLPSYYGRTGDVTEIRQRPSYTQVRVDFRRGLGPCWMEDSNVERVAVG